MLIRRFAAALTALGVAAALGCSDSVTATVVDFGGDDGRAVAKLVAEFDEGKGSPKRAAGFFAKAAKPAPADAKKYQKYVYDVVAAPAVTGDEATAKVSFRPEAGGADLEAKEWAFVREGGAWKIKAAPLP